MKLSRVLYGLILLLANVLCSVAMGQPVGTTRDSLQWMIARADAIVRGPVDSVVAINPGDKFVGYYQVTIQTPTRIAGQIDKEVCFVVTNQKPYVKLKNEEHEGLFFLVRSQIELARRDFDSNRRRRNDYFFSRCPVICKNVIDLGAESTSVTSFDPTGLKQLVGRKVILDEVQQYLGTIQRGKRIGRYYLREPDHRAFTEYDSTVAVPLDHHRLTSVAKKWSAAKGVKARIGRDIENAFSELIAFEAAKAKHAAKEQVPTDWRRANSLSIDSLEWMASDSDVIVRGTIEDSVLLQLGDPNSRTTYEATLDIHLVKLRVSEQIKGEVDRTISFVVGNGGKLAEWQRRKTPIMVFLKDRGMQAQSGPMRLVAATYHNIMPMLRYAARGTDTKAIIAFDDGHPQIFSAQLEWTSDPHEMLAIVRGYLEQVPSARESRSRNSVSLSFEPPKAFLKDATWNVSRYARMKFPVDSYLEEHARRWIKSERKEDRWLGAYSLVYFKSEENAEALKRLLDDPGKWQAPFEVSHPTHLKVTYLVRWEAWTILNAWGYDVAKPSFGT